jgi:hypothetical protein
VVPHWPATSDLKWPSKRYGPLVNHLTSLRCQVSILRVLGPMWYIGTSLWTAGVFNSKIIKE